MRFAFRLGDRFVPEEELRTRAKEVSRSIGRHGIEGTIYLVCNETEIMGENEFDYIDHLLYYITNGIDTIFRGEPFATNFPDRSLQLTINTQHEIILIAVGKRRAAVPRREFLRELYDLCRRFFEFMLILRPSGWDEPTVKDLKNLPSRYPMIFAGHR